MKRALILALTCALCACSDPKDIVLGPDPLAQLAEQGDKFKKLPQEDRALLVAYLGASEIGKAFGGALPSPTGRTVGEVLVEARAWKAKVEAAREEREKKRQEEEALRQKVLQERAQIAAKISSSAVVAVIGKEVLPKDFNAGRYSEMLTITLAVENKTAKGIKQIKGRVTFKDPTGDEIGSLPVDIDAPVRPGETIKTDTGRGWKLNQFMNGAVEKIAGREYSAMSATFEPESIAFDDGEVLKGPDLP